MREKEVICNFRQDGNPPFNCKLPANHSGDHLPIEPTNKRETRDEARQRIGKALQTEIEEMRKTGLTDMMLGLKVYAAMVDSRYELEQLKTRLAFELHLNNRFIRRNA